MPTKEKIPRDSFLPLVRRAIEEDIGVGDMTTTAVVGEQATAKGRVVAAEPCVIAGLPMAEAVFDEIDEEIEFTPLVEEGATIKADTVIAELQGPARSLLTGERTALNFVGWLSGIATLTAQFVAKVGTHKAYVLDTRKTRPGLRLLEKYAVRVGGGKTHRMGLHDQFFVKNNHLLVLRGSREERIRKCVAAARTLNPNTQVEIEAVTLDDVRTAVEAGADIIMLDRMPLADVKHAVQLASGKAVVAASGAVTLETAANVAATGVDYITVGALTTHAPHIRVQLELST